MAKKSMSIGARFEYLRSMQERYQKADRTEKGRLLDEMESVTRLSRKHLVAQMNNPDLRRRARSKERQREYGDDVSRAITIIADTLDWICAERLQPALGEMAECLISWGELETSADVLAKLNRISISTVGRILSRIRPSLRLPRAHRGRRAESRVQQVVPVSVIPWDEAEPGHFEVDLVHHGSPGEDGQLIYTMQFVDVLTGWSERFAIMGHNFETIWHTIKKFEEICPIPVREIHSDNGSEFINQPLISVFGQELVNVLQTRGRPRHPNDNRMVEQKKQLSCTRLFRVYVSAHSGTASGNE